MEKVESMKGAHISGAEKSTHFQGYFALKKVHVFVIIIN